MTRKEKVYNELVKLCKEITLDKLNQGFCGFDAITIGKNIDISRSNASRELNALVSEKRAIKILGRPVYYIERSTIERVIKTPLSDDKMEFNTINDLFDFQNDMKGEEPDINYFDKVIGSDGSLKIAIEQAKAAILYPPKGLNTLLVGPTGVGKTTFAEMMYNYGVNSGRIASDAKFNIFNCSEYADNPQLLLSQLFGHAKGSFTGADKDKSGLIEKTNGGILLLDEIHRLPPEGQEMLFLLMDKGIYRRLGETEETRNASILLIGATTEDINSFLLKTFLRRVPMIIKLPSLVERPLKERFQLIQQFFRDEVKHVQAPIKVYKEVIRAFLLYECQGNIGQLKGDIQLTCARGFLDYKTYNKKGIEIDTTLIPEHVYRGLFNIEGKRNEIINLLELNSKKYYKFSHSSSEPLTVRDDYDMSKDLYREIYNKYYNYSKQGYSNEQIKDMINGYIEKYLQKLMEKCNAKQEIPVNEELFKVVSPRVFYAVEMALKVAEQKLKKKFSKKVYIALALHISAIMEKSDKNTVFDSYRLNEIALNNPKEFNTARLVKRILEEELEIDLPNEEIGFIAMFLYAVDSDEMQKNRNIGVIVLTHGRYTASSIAEVANNLLGTDHCKAIDMPLEEKVENVLGKTKNLVKEVNEGKGVLLLVDMGSLVAFAEIITKETNIKTLSVEMVSTPMVIEAVRKCFLPEMTLEDLVEDLQETSPYIGRLVTNNIKNKTSITKPKTIITTCLTGEGSAIKLAELLENTISAIAEYNIKLKPVNKESYKNVISADEELLAVVGTINLDITNVPYIPIDEVIIGDGLKRIEKIIVDADADSSSVNTSPNIIVEKMLKEHLTFLDPVKAYETVNATFKRITGLVTIKEKEYKRVKVGYILHCCYMIERILKREPICYKNVEKLIENKSKLYELVKNSSQVQISV